MTLLANTGHIHVTIVGMERTQMEQLLYITEGHQSKHQEERVMSHFKPHPILFCVLRTKNKICLNQTAR